jgi:hypothetical protein
MSAADCIAEIKAAAGAELSDDQVEQLVSRIAARARAAGAGREAISAAAKQLADQARMTAAIAKRNALINLQTRIARRERIQSASDLITGIKAEIHGVATPLTGGRFSAEAEWKAWSRLYQERMVNELDRAGLLGAARGRALERAWARELFELSKGEPAPAKAGGNPGVSQSPEALKIAQTIHKYQTLAKENLNKAGGWIGDYSGYITRTQHNPDKIRQAGAPAWIAAIRPLLDDRTWEGLDDPQDPEEQRQFLNNVWHALVTGVHLTHDGMQGFKDPAFTGPANLAKRLSAERVLHFRDADAWLDYHDRFGNGSLIRAVVDALDRAARATALMRHFGTNPRAEFKADLKYFAETWRNTDPDQVIKLRQAAADNERGDLWNRFDFLDGTANIPVNRLGARVASTLRIVESMAKLGLVMFTHLSSGMTKAAEFHYQGIGLLAGYRDFVESVWRGRGGAGSDTREVMDRLVAAHEGMLRDIAGRFETDDGIPGTLSKLANIFFRLSGLTYLFNAQRAGAEFAMARHLGALLDRPHGELPAETQRILRLFGVGAEHWEMLRQVADHVDIEGRRFLTPDAAMRIPDDAVDQYNAARIQEMRDRIEGRRRQLEARDAQEAKWEADRLAKFRDDLETRAETLGGLTDQDRERIELARARLEHAETLTAILAGLRGMRSRNAVQRAIEAQDRARWSAWTERRALQVAGDQAERLTARNLNAGERLGLRRGELEGRIADLEERIAGRPAELKDWLAGRLQELGEYRARMEARIAARAEEIAGLDTRLPQRIEALRDDTRQDLALRLHAYFNDRSEHVVIIPGVATRADVYRGTRPGTPEGEVLRFIGQFKTWPAALVRMALGREWYGRGEKGPWRPAAIAGILHMVVAGTVLGYGIMVLKDLLKGRNPRDPTDPKTWGAAMMQGGGLGILGDFLFGDFNRFGQNVGETIMGPVLGQGLSSVLQLWNDAKEGRDLAPEAFRTLVYNTPFINLFYTRLALDYLFLWQVQEYLNPGFLRRFEHRVESQNHQTFWLRPSEVVAAHHAATHRHPH